MPELPEVEVLRLQIESALAGKPVLTGVQFRRKDLRFKIPCARILSLRNQTLMKMGRRSKYLLFEFEKGGILSHLGMSGAWRFRRKHEEFLKHDHIVLTFDEEKEMIYNDSRRFGVLDHFHKQEEHPLLTKLGFEALEVKNFIPQIALLLKKKSVTIKTALLDQRLIAGLGNIYVNEVLYQARISPFRQVSKLRRMEVETLMTLIPPLMNEAIIAGGSTLKDYKHLDSTAGGFQNRFQIYDREGDVCLKCDHLVQMKFQNARSTYWCSKCQK